jgi:hypothetical protein
VAIPATEPPPASAPQRITLSGTGAARAGAPASPAPSVSTLPPPRLTLEQIYAAQRASVRSTTTAPAPLSRVGALAAATPFDPAQWERDPDEYLSVIEPARVYQTARYAAHVPGTLVSGPTGYQVPPGGQVELVFTSAPNAPLNLFSNGLGAFDNGLTSISLRTDAQGVASLTWTASAGTTGDVNVLAASPLAHGQASIFINVTSE